MTEAMCKRPYIFCHMETSLDGKIMGKFWSVLRDLEDDPFIELAFTEKRAWQHQGWISGRITTDDNFTKYAEPNLLADAPEVPAGDFVTALEDGYYFISIDPHGRLGWKENVVRYKGMAPRIIEVLSDATSNAYKDFLRRMDIPYIICGEESIDFALMLEKLAEIWKIDCLMLGGGGVLNWSFIQQGLCDEVSVVIDPSADGSTETQTLFMQRDGLSTTDPVRFHLKSVEAVGQNNERIWARYTVEAAR